MAASAKTSHGHAVEHADRRGERGQQGEPDERRPACDAEEEVDEEEHADARDHHEGAKDGGVQAGMGAA